MLFLIDLEVVFTVVVQIGGKVEDRTHQIDVSERFGYVVEQRALFEEVDVFRVDVVVVVAVVATAATTNIVVAAAVVMRRVSRLPPKRRAIFTITIIAGVSSVFFFVFTGRAFCAIA